MLEPSLPSSTTSVAAPPEAPVTSNGDLHAVPDSEATTGPLAAAHAQGSDRMDEDEGMTDDMRIAISALGLMREGSLSGKSPTPTTSSAHAPLHHQQQQPLHAEAARTDPFFAEPVHSLAGGAQARGRSDSRRSDPSRSASTASMASYSEAAWTGAGTSETGFSSPAGSMYIANGAVGSSRDAEMGPHNGTAAGGGPGEPHPAADDPHFMARVSQLPIVSGGIEWYERSKANSRVVKVGGNPSDASYCQSGRLHVLTLLTLVAWLRFPQYGADLVESSISAVSRPIANNLPLGGALDDFACRQLDRISASPSRRSPRALPEVELGSVAGREGSQGGMDMQDGGSSGSGAMAANADHGLSPNGASLGPGDGQLTTIHGGQRSRWQTVLLEAGGLGAAVSEESLKSLRYCLQWLLVSLLPEGTIGDSRRY